MITFITSGVISFFNGSIFPVLLAVGGIICFGWMYIKANKITNRKRDEIQKEIIKRNKEAFTQKEYFVASAGSKDAEASTMVSARDIQYCDFLDSKGNPLNQTLYNCYVVHGDSMKYAGINNNDFIFVPKDFNLNSLKSFPEILVIRYREQNESKPLYKVRRAWYIGSIEDDLEKAVRSVMNNPKFNRLTQQTGYKGSDWMIKDLLKKRLANYKSTYFKEGKCTDPNKQIVISTTFDSINKEIHFSIHPVSLIVGTVEEAYTI